MKHTPESLAAMSDEQVFGLLSDVSGLYVSRNSQYESVMPLVFEHGISLIKVIDGYVAIKYDFYIDIGSHEDIKGICADGTQFGDTNPLRAAACCLILVLQENKQ